MLDFARPNVITMKFQIFQKRTLTTYVENICLTGILQLVCVVCDDFYFYLKYVHNAVDEIMIKCERNYCSQNALNNLKYKIIAKENKKNVHNGECM